MAFRASLNFTITNINNHEIRSPEIQANSCSQTLQASFQKANQESEEKMTAAAEQTIREHLMLAIAVILIGGITLGWVGGKAVDYTFQDVRENSSFRVSQIEKNRSNDQRLDTLENLMRSLIDNSTITRESVIRIEEQLKQWEPIR